MGLLKDLSRSETVRRPLCWVAAQYIRLVHRTGRWQTVGGEIPTAFWDRGEPFILAFWHGRILMMPRIWRHEMPIKMLISSHRDGLIIARTIKHLGIDTVAGSTTRGGGAALRALLKSIKEGVSVGITPDGPHGPYMRATDGVAQLGKLSGAKIIPCAYAVDRRRVIRSWDRFILAWPFSRGVFVWGEPIAVARDADDDALEAVRLHIERTLNVLTRDADARMGHSSLVPPEAAS